MTPEVLHLLKFCTFHVQGSQCGGILPSLPRTAAWHQNLCNWAPPRFGVALAQCRAEGVGNDVMLSAHV